MAIKIKKALKFTNPTCALAYEVVVSIDLRVKGATIYELNFKNLEDGKSSISMFGTLSESVEYISTQLNFNEVERREVSLALTSL